MNNDVHLARLETLRRSLLVVGGVILSLFVTALAGDLRYFSGEAPAGWFLLWAITSAASVGLGILLLMKKPWGTVPLRERRGPAMGYLLAGFINLVSFGLFNLTTEGIPICVILPIPYALLLFLVYHRAFWLEDGGGRQTFP